MLTALNLVALLAVLDPATPNSAAPDPLYVIEGSVVQTGETRLATVVVPLDDRGLMSMRVEVDCTQQRYRTMQVVFYNPDGSLRASVGEPAGSAPVAGWATRNGARISARVCT